MTRRNLLAAAYVAVFLFTAFQAVRRIYTLKTDFDGFWRAGRAVLAGHDPYEATPGPVADKLLFPGLRKPEPPKAEEREGEEGGGTESAVKRYLPFFGLLMAPFALFPMDVACLLWHGLSFVSLLWALKSSYRLLGRDVSLLSAGAVAPLVATAIFWADAFTMGQIGIVTLALSVAAIDLARTRPWLGGAAAGLAAAIKVTPAIVGVYFLLKRRWAAAAASFAAFALCASIALPVWGPSRSVALHRTWLHESASTAGAKFFELRQSIRYHNQSLHAWAARLFMDVNAGRGNRPFRVNVASLSPAATAWIVRGLQAGLGLMCLAVFLARRNGEPLTLPETGVLMAATTFLSPIAWTFHLAVALPAAVCLWDRRAEKESRAWLAVAVALQLGMIHPFTRAIGLPMFACLAAMLGAWRAAVRARSRPGPETAASPTA